MDPPDVFHGAWWIFPWYLWTGIGLAVGIPTLLVWSALIAAGNADRAMENWSSDDETDEA